MLLRSFLCTQNDPHRNTYDADDSNHTVFIQDWMNITQNTNYMEYLYGVGHNQPDFLLINGKGRGPVFKGETGNGSFFVPREVFHVQSSLRYRMRVISNAFTGCQMQVSIDNHSLLAINMDSYPIVPVPFDALISNAGERFDFILHANQSIGNYWLRLKGVGDNCETLQELAIIRYMRAPEEDPTAPERSLTTPSRLLNAPESSTVNAPTIIRMINLTSLIRFAGNQKANSYYLPLGLEDPKVREPRLRGRKRIPQINHITFTYPPVPLLTQHNEVDQSLFCDARVASTWTNCTDIQCRCTQIISVALNR
ncbi:laccase-type phenoloxidase [Apostichopus japonicus]|uniref:Laccase-type phenoloxidase n=1 Tax=Stichopus japonicus TaxID=307972 RepID=A0A2G8KNM8_STIJA|nr:laccase-type phenoloxidase [Apostichopus japonicus]